jgi:DNA-binding MarR family transcriptional regulator
LSKKVAGIASALRLSMTDFDPRRSSSSSTLTDASCADDAVAAPPAADDGGGSRGSRRRTRGERRRRAVVASIELARRRLASKRAYRATMRTLGEWAGAFNLTPARFEILAAIASHPLGTTQRTLSKALSISQGTTSRMVARLVRLELVRVSPNPADARKRLLMLSEEGERRLVAAQASFFEAGYGTPDPELLN